MSIEQKNNLKLSNLRMRGTSSRRLGLSLSICALMLTGCASSPTVIAPDCPAPTPVPASLSESDLPAVQNYSAEVQSFLKEVADWLANAP